MLTYPTLQDVISETPALVAAIRSGGAGFDKAAAVHAGYTVLGYGLSQLSFATPPVPSISMSPAAVEGPTSEADLANALERLDCASQMAGAHQVHRTALAAIDWNAVISLVLPLILKWVAK